MQKIDDIIDAAQQLIKSSVIKDDSAVGVVSDLIEAFLKTNKRFDRILKQSDKMGAVIANQKDALEETLEQLKKSQDQLVQSEKLAALGKLVAGVAHEINTPIGAIQSTTEAISESTASIFEALPEIVGMLNADERNVFFSIPASQPAVPAGRQTSREKREIRKRIGARLQEIGVDGDADLCVKLARLGLERDIESIKPLLSHPERDRIIDLAGHLFQLDFKVDNIRTAVAKTSKIVFALKSYAQVSESGEGVEFDLEENIRNVLLLNAHLFKKEMVLTENFQQIGSVFGNPDELSQVWHNLIYNALQAMKFQGELSIAVKKNDDFIVIEIEDSGPGIPMDIQQRIFDPFFTTKPTGEGSGLGLDIVRQIIERHHGTVTFQSEIGIGTCFQVQLPLTR
jgi:signal transduction histidine kinase